MPSNPSRIIFVVFAALIVLATRTAVAANLLSNSDFDNGVTGWVPRTPGHDVLAIVSDGSPTAPALDISLRPRGIQTHAVRSHSPGSIRQRAGGAVAVWRELSTRGGNCNAPG
jgi:hypothetical protein